MNPPTVFCPNLDGLARGQVGKGNIGIHSLKEQRYICHVCDQTFAATKGTVFYRLQTAPAVVTTVIALLAPGCPLSALVAVFPLDERTVADWPMRAGDHGKSMSSSSNHRATWVRGQPMKFASRGSRRSSGWRWRSTSRRGCGWERPWVSNETRRG